MLLLLQEPVAAKAPTCSEGFLLLAFFAPSLLVLFDSGLPFCGVALSHTQAMGDSARNKDVSASIQPRLDTQSNTSDHSSQNKTTGKAGLDVGRLPCQLVWVHVFLRLSNDQIVASIRTHMQAAPPAEGYIGQRDSANTRDPPLE